jgi:hypothetical protein
MGEPPRALASIACKVITTEMNIGYSFVNRLIVEILFLFILSPLVTFKGILEPQWYKPIVNKVNNTRPIT